MRAAPAPPLPGARPRTVLVPAALAWLAVLLYMGFIFYLSAQSDPLPILTKHVWDKLLHSIEYGTLGLLLALALRASGASEGTALLLAAAFASLYGASDEVHQAFVPLRDCDIHDWMADTLGGALGATALTVVLRLKRARASIGRARPGG
ncbi:MAG TPA: VanZ family protein [Anaeromyxobacteraceae bacterium]|nr:VanZ family protein [Anaeromyxobacteraceae bacterium]